MASSIVSWKNSEVNLLCIGHNFANIWIFRRMQRLSKYVKHFEFGFQLIVSNRVKYLMIILSISKCASLNHWIRRCIYWSIFNLVCATTIGRIKRARNVRNTKLFWEVICCCEFVRTLKNPHYFIIENCVLATIFGYIPSIDREFNLNIFCLLGCLFDRCFIPRVFNSTGWTIWLDLRSHW